MDRLTYNGIVLSIIRIKRLTMEREFLPDSGTLCTRFDFDIEAVIWDDANMKDLRKGLLEPRKNLSVTLQSKELVNISGVDANNGPLPQFASILVISGSTPLVVRFYITAFVPEEE